jgi:hypothetical protein
MFLKDGKPAFLCLPPSQKWLLVDITGAQHVWRTVKEAGFQYLHTQNLHEDPLENIFVELFIRTVVRTIIQLWDSL